jgi:hypothetical protein
MIVRLGDDSNWWVDQTSDGSPATFRRRHVLDPRQVDHLARALQDYDRFGCGPRQFASAFQAFEAESEQADGRLRLKSCGEDLAESASPLFAWPRVDEQDEGPYLDFLEAVGDARIRLLNATHHYARACTESEMYEELDTLDQDRYFSAENIHVFDEINEILEWKPAQWDEAVESGA